MTTRKYLYMLKLFDGRLIFKEGTGWEDASRKARVKLSKVKRHMPVKAVLTAEEKRVRNERFKRLREKHSKDDK